MRREQVLGAADRITDNFRGALDARGQPWKRARKSLEERTQLRLGERGMNEAKLILQTGTMWSGIGVAEKDNGRVLDCCVHNQSFERGVGILSESRGKCLNAWSRGLWGIREWNSCRVREIARTIEVNCGSSQGNMANDDE
jgi:hypothetical protein